jgi:hypothetical protein
MNKTFSSGTLLFGALLAAAGNRPVQASEPGMPAAVDAAGAAGALPHRGERQAEVLREFGEPQRRHAPVGGGSPKRPPITRWDYAGWSVFFERSAVVDVVVPNDPPPISHVDELSARAGRAASGGAGW